MNRPALVMDAAEPRSRTDNRPDPGRPASPAAEPLPRPPGPPRHKLALLTWAAAYAVITAILAAIGPTLAAWPLALRTLVLSVLMVAALTWVVMPALTRLCRGWLAPNA